MRRLAAHVRFLLALAAKLTALGPRRRDRAAITAACLLLGAARLAPTGAVRVRLRLRYRARDLRWTVADVSELEALAEVLCDESYALAPALEPRTIVDLGSHVGSSILYFACRYPGARILGVEADPDTLSRLRANVGGLPGVELVNVAVAGGNGVVSFFPSRKTWGSTARPGEVHGAAITVPARSLDRLLEDARVEHVDLLKIDVEGSEYETLRAAESLETRIGAIVGEFHVFMPAVAREEAAFFDLLKGFEVSRARDGQLFFAYRR
jgi:FkbM family methyltransferase